jgi:phosphoglycolate phosphatase
MINFIDNFEAIIFDLDGTLVDSLPDMSEALNRTLADDGRRLLDVDEVRPLIGGGVSKMIRSAYELTGTEITNDNLVTAVAGYISYYKEFPDKYSELYSGVKETLDHLQTAGVKMGVCSNKAYEMVCLILESFDLEKYFCAVTGGDNVAFNKPDGRHILETLDQMLVVGTGVLMVGDTINDIVAAHDAGVHVVAVDYGYSSPNELLSATRIFSDIRQLSSLV